MKNVASVESVFLKKKEFKKSIKNKKSKIGHPVDFGICYKKDSIPKCLIRIKNPAIFF